MTMISAGSMVSGSAASLLLVRAELWHYALEKVRGRGQQPRDVRELGHVYYVRLYVECHKRTYCICSTEVLLEMFYLDTC